MPVYDDSDRPVSTIKHLLGRPRTHSTGPINPSSRAPTSSSSSTGEASWEIGSEGASRRADRPLHGVMAGSRSVGGTHGSYPADTEGRRSRVSCAPSKNRSFRSPSSSISWDMHASIRVLPALLDHAYLPQFSDLHLVVASQSTPPG